MIRFMDAVKRACELLGGISATATVLRVTPPTVHEWCTDRRQVPPKRALGLELALGGTMKRWDFRPDDWFEHWPELIGTDGAPELPELQAKTAAA